MPTRKPKPPLSSKSQRNILMMAGRYYYITARQVTRLLFRESIHNYSQKLLAEMTRAEYLVRSNYIEKGINPGKPEYVWSLTTKGRNALAEMDEGFEVKLPHSPEKQQLFMKHTQAINDTLITAELFAKENPDAVFLDQMEHDQTLHRWEIRVPMAGNKLTTVTPDGWVHFTVNDTPGAVVFEVDRGTEGREKFQTKVRALRTLLFGRDEIYKKHFGDHDAQIAVVIRSVANHRIKSSEKRLHDLLTWTEAVLEDATGLGVFFAMTAVDPATVSPTEFFTGKHWFMPFSQAPRSLIPPERLSR